MQLNDIVQIKAQIKKDIKVGDFIMLGEMFKTERNTIRMRYERNKEREVLAMRSLVNNRKQFIKNFQELNNIK